MELAGDYSKNVSMNATRNRIPFDRPRILLAAVAFASCLLKEGTDTSATFLKDERLLE